MTDKQVLNVGDIIPNDTKSIVGKWYAFNGSYMIEPIKINTDVHDTYKGIQYRFNIVFPTPPRHGISPDQIVLQGGKGHDWACYFYSMHEHDVPKQIVYLTKRLKDLGKENKILQARNRRLEKHFSRTAYDEQAALWKHDELKGTCEHCNEDIDKKKQIVGADWIELNDGDLYHLKCAVYVLGSICKSCGAAWTEDTEEGICPECSGLLRNVSKAGYF